MTLKDNLQFIREALDTDTTFTDLSAEILPISEKLQSLIQLSGLSSECKAKAKKEYEHARLHAIMKLQKDNPRMNSTLLIKMADGMCAEQIETLTYADRLNAGITHAIDGLRSLISLYKEERMNSLTQVNNRYGTKN